MDIEEIKEKAKLDKYEISFHAEKERYAEDITISDLETAIYNGEILEAAWEVFMLDVSPPPKEPLLKLPSLLKNKGVF